MSKFHKKVFSFICVFPARKTNILKGKLRPLAFIAFALLATPLFIALAAQAADICVGPSSDGNGSGSDWNNPKAWSGTPARGDTWYLADGSYSGKTFSVAASGSTLITIKKATLSDHGPSTGWSDTIGDGQATFSGQIDFESSYWVFDGQTGGGPGSWSSGYGFKITETDDASAVILMGYNAPANNITVRHVDMQGKGSPSQQGGATRTTAWHSMGVPTSRSPLRGCTALAGARSLSPRLIASLNTFTFRASTAPRMCIPKSHLFGPLVKLWATQLFVTISSLIHILLAV